MQLSTKVRGNRDEYFCKPCPFCGGEDLGMSDATIARAVVTIECACGAEGPRAHVRQTLVRRPRSDDARATWDANAVAAETRAVELWNKRVR